MVRITFLARRKRTKTRRPITFKAKDRRVRFKARRRPKRRTRVEFQTRPKWW